MDQDIRHLERQAAQGDVDADAKLLLERVRAGELTEERLLLAARLGHEGATVALGDSGLCTYSALVYQGAGDAWLWELAQAVAGLGWEPAIRAAICCARMVLPVVERLAPEERRLRQAVEAAEAQLTCPCSDHQTAAESAAEELADAANLTNLIGRGADQALMNVVFSASHTASLASLDRTRSADALEECLLSALMGSWVCEVCDRKRRGESAPSRTSLVQAMIDEVLPWAVGLGDPVRDRVEARQRETANE